MQIQLTMCRYWRRYKYVPTCLSSLLVVVGLDSLSSGVLEITFEETITLLSLLLQQLLSGALGSLPCSGHGAILNVRDSWVRWLVKHETCCLTHAYYYSSTRFCIMSLYTVFMLMHMVRMTSTRIHKHRWITCL